MKSQLTLNIPFATKVLDHLLAHPEEHDQEFYGTKTACGTRACIAGTAVMMDAHTKVEWFTGTYMLGTVWVGDHAVDIDERAADLLGLDYEDDARLFHNYDNGSALNTLASYIDQAVHARVGGAG